MWLDPLRYAVLVKRIGDAIGRPEEAERLERRLRALDREYRDGLVDCARHEIVTSHEAFAYLADRYGLEQISITGLSPEAEPTPQEPRTGVVDAVRDTGATTVFFETLVSPRVAKTVAREAGVTTAVLNPIEGLTREPAGARRRLLLAHARESHHAARGARVPLAVELKDVTFAYPGGHRSCGTSTSPSSQGEFVAIAGPNGGGKTTLLRVAPRARAAADRNGRTLRRARRSPQRALPHRLSRAALTARVSRRR